MARAEKATTIRLASHPKASASNEQASTQTSSAQQVDASQANWFSLLSFTTRYHLGVFSAAICLSIAAGVIEPVFAILLGDIFDQFTSYGSSSIQQDTFQAKIRVYCLYAMFIGLASWLLNACFFCTWLTFGELQARCCRVKLFEALLCNSITWYDLLEAGNASLASRLHSCVVNNLNYSISEADIMTAKSGNYRSAPRSH